VEVIRQLTDHQLAGRRQQTSARLSVIQESPRIPAIHEDRLGPVPEFCPTSIGYRSAGGGTRKMFSFHGPHKRLISCMRNGTRAQYLFHNMVI
jgi:hypothetical protein